MVLLGSSLNQPPANPNPKPKRNCSGCEFSHLECQPGSGDESGQQAFYCVNDSGPVMEHLFGAQLLESVEDVEGALKDGSEAIGCPGYSPRGEDAWDDVRSDPSCLEQQVRHLEGKVAHLNAQIESLKKDPSYGIYSRQGLEIVWDGLVTGGHKDLYAIIFCDLDDLKAANTERGAAKVDRQISEWFSTLRANEALNGELVNSRYYSGDEFAILCPASEARAAAQRLADGLRAVNLTAVFAIVDCASDDLAQNCEVASAIVQRVKKQKRKSLARLIESAQIWLSKRSGTPRKRSGVDQIIDARTQA